ncbi:hypothetical protein SAMN04487926_1579 [Paraburkholderia steynii]|uniref:Uncharacterized protein n=1 Tax=Paraburkholderia steynii TaxID=1245441 RepID=A0A7Z7BL74_9BURK|nr:hypothetical protein [Paraburkholderia steynii]SDJ50947.1 hypothetical protein SAMN04487926_1579 [Paraburkholderia steynii]
MSIHHCPPDELTGQAVAAARVLAVRSAVIGVDFTGQDEITSGIVDLATTAARAPLQSGAQGA